MDVVLLTDHDNLDAIRLGEEGWYGRTLLLAGHEISPPVRNHLLAFGVDEEIDWEGLTPRQIADAVRDAGGFGIAAHPFSSASERFSRVRSLGESMCWEDLDCLDGIEVWSFVSDNGQNVSGVGDAVRFVTRPERYVTHPPRGNLDEWDRLAAARRVVGIGGLDAHQFGVRVAGRALRLMSYHRSFRQLRTHVLVREQLDGDLAHDRAQVFEALREGRCLHLLARGGAGARVPVLRATAWRWAPRPRSTGQELHAELPRPAEVRLMRDGTEVAPRRWRFAHAHGGRARRVPRRGLPGDVRRAAHVAAVEPGVPAMTEVRLDPSRSRCATSPRWATTAGTRSWSRSPRWRRAGVLAMDLRDSMDGEVTRGSTDEDLLSLPRDLARADRAGGRGGRRARRRARAGDHRLRDRRLRLDGRAARVRADRRPDRAALPRALGPGRRGRAIGRPAGRRGGRVHPRGRDRRGAVGGAVRGVAAPRTTARRRGRPGAPTGPRSRIPPGRSGRPSHHAAARERRQHGRARPRPRRHAAAPRARGGRPALGGRPPLRPGRRRDLGVRDRDQRLGHVPGGPAPGARLGAAVPRVLGAAAGAARMLRHHRRARRRRRLHGPGRRRRAGRWWRCSAGWRASTACTAARRWR